MTLSMNTGSIKQGSEGGSEESEGYMSASDERATPNQHNMATSNQHQNQHNINTVSSSISPQPPKLLPAPVLAHSDYMKAEDREGVTLPPTSSSGMFQPPTSSHMPLASSPDVLSQTSMPLTSSSNVHSQMTQHHQGMAQHPAMHPIPTSLAANQHRLKSPSIGQSPPNIGSGPTPLDSRGSPMPMMMSAGQISPPGGRGINPAHSGSNMASSPGYPYHPRMTSNGQGMTLPVGLPTMPPTANMAGNTPNNYTHGSYMTSAPKLTHL